VLGLSGPFDTFDALRTIPRIGYWGLIVLTTYAVGIFMITATSERLPQTLPDWLCDGIAGVITGPVITLIVLLINAAVFTTPPDQPIPSTPNLMLLLFYCTAITVVVAVIVGQAHTSTLPTQPKNTGSDTIPLLDRLPFEKRGALVSLQAQDHYVQITTTKGQELVLIRIGDAIKEVGATYGLQTHRSYWVALDQITTSKRIGERGVLTLSNGDEAPVSRKYIPALKAAGFCR
jgi:hypothetical protein